MILLAQDSHDARGANAVRLLCFDAPLSIYIVDCIILKII